MNQTRQLSIDDAQWWDELYSSKKTPWDLNKPAPPLQSYLKSPYVVPPGKMAVVGCGTGEDCLLFAKAGFEVTGIDFASKAITATYEKMKAAKVAGTNGYLLQRDVFDIHEYDNYYDYVLEHCFFSAIDPVHRRRYMYTMRDLLKPDGKLIALWWVHDKPGGPPFAFSKDELYKYIDGIFNIEICYEPTDSVAERKGQELFTVLSKIR